MLDYYKILEIEPEASQSEVKRSYYRLANKYHPDKTEYSDASELFTQIAEAYRILSDETRRTEYDQKRASKNQLVLYTNSSLTKTFEKGFDISDKPGPIKKENAPGFNPKVFSKGIMFFGLFFTFLLLIDFVLPPKSETIQVTEKVNSKNNSVMLQASNGTAVRVSEAISNQIKSNSEITLNYSRIFDRFCQIGINEWPYTLKVRASNQSALFFVSLVLVSLCAIGLYTHSKKRMQLYIGISVILLVIGQIVLLII